MLKLKHWITNNWRCLQWKRWSWVETKWQNWRYWILSLQSSIDSKCWDLDLTVFISWNSANNPLDGYNRKICTDSSCPHLIKLWKRHKNKLREEQTDRECQVCERMSREGRICKWRELNRNSSSRWWLVGERFRRAGASMDNRVTWFIA